VAADHNASCPRLARRRLMRARSRSGNAAIHASTSSACQSSGRPRGPRPPLGYVPASVGYGQRFDIQTSSRDAIARVVLVRVASVTHGINTDQRLLELHQRARGPARVTIEAPGDATLAPPGYYMLFAIGTTGVPSVGRFSHVR